MAFWRKIVSAKYAHALCLIFFWPAVALVTWGELTPNPPDVPLLDAWDKLEHFTAYFGLAAMATVTLGMRRALLWAALGLILLGGLLEILQAYTGRDPDIFDAVANSIGVLCGVGAGWAVLTILPGGPLDGKAPGE